MRIALLLSLIYSSQISATTFKLVPLEQQVAEADSIIYAHYLRQNSTVLDDGRVATQMHFELKREIGLKTELNGMHELIVHYPGGEMNGVVTKVDGVPTFNSGEKVVLLLKNKANRFWGLNLAYGSFKVINFGHSSMVMNNVFPDQPHAGQMPLHQFDNLVKQVKGVSFTQVQNLEVLEKQNIQSSGQNRSLASISEVPENTSDKSVTSMFWLLASLGFMGGLFRWSRRQAK